MSSELSCHNSRVPQPLRWAAWVGLLVFGLARAEASEPFFFNQPSDPPFGMCAANADVQQETANFEFAIASIDELAGYQLDRGELMLPCLTVRGISPP